MFLDAEPPSFAVQVLRILSSRLRKPLARLEPVKALLKRPASSKSPSEGARGASRGK